MEPELTKTQLAEKRCRSSIEWYCSNAKLHRNAFYALQSLTILASAVSSIIVAADTGGLLPAIVPALGATAASLLASFGVRERWIRSAATAELLKSELFLFQLKSTQIYARNAAPEDPAATFASRIEAIILGETEAWKLAASRLEKEQKEKPANARDANALSGVAHE